MIIGILIVATGAGALIELSNHRHKRQVERNYKQYKSTRK